MATKNNKSHNLEIKASKKASVVKADTCAEKPKKVAFTN